METNQSAQQKFTTNALDTQMELLCIELGENPAPLTNPLHLILRFKVVDTKKKFKLSLIADITNKRHVIQVPPAENRMNDKGELIWDIQGSLIEGFKGNMGLISIEDMESTWKCNCVVMVNDGIRTVLNPLE
jgi:hypothetical protein